LVKAGLNSVCVSVDSPVRSVHDRMRGASGAFKQTIGGIRTLRRAAERCDVSLPIRINTVVSRENYDTLDRLPEFAYSLGAQHLLLIPVDDPSGTLRLSKRRLADYNDRIAPALVDRALALGLMHARHEAFPFGVTRQELAASREGRYAQGLYERQPCYAPWTHALVAADGRVAPCCSAPRVTLGDLKQQSFGQTLPHCAGCDVFLAENQTLHRICGNETDLGSAR
jgi:MoaA/NifB/PqqE/SkfB family radical SAM enzyme